MTLNFSLPSLALLALALACGDSGKNTSNDGTATGTASTSSTSSGSTSAVTSGAGSTSDASNSQGSGESSSGQFTSTSTSAGGTSTSASTSTSTGNSSGGEGGTTLDPSTGDPSTGSSGGEGCQGQGESCAGVGALCCKGLDCCAGVPVPEGKEFCSNDCPISDRNLKTDITALDPAEVLQRVVALPISTWRYKKDGPEVRHLGPMAQDFHAAFGLWDTDRMIFPLDASGVSLAAIQALNDRLVAAEAENEDLKARLERLEQRSAR